MHLSIELSSSLSDLTDPSILMFVRLVRRARIPGVGELGYAGEIGRNWMRGTAG